MALENPLAEDKKCARENLRGGFEKALKTNVLNAPILGEEKTCIFEIGRIFTKEGEKTALAIGVAGPKKKIAGVLESALLLLSQPPSHGLGTPSLRLSRLFKGDTKDGVFECVLDDVFEKLPEPKKWDISIPSAQSEKFAPFSLFPFIVRDIALFVSPLEKGVPPSSGAGVVYPSAEVVAKAIKQNAGNLVVRGPELFDEFTKDGKKSLAFRLVFQSSDRTLSDEEVNEAMEEVYSALKGKGWEVR